MSGPWKYKVKKTLIQTNIEKTKLIIIKTNYIYINRCTHIKIDVHTGKVTYSLKILFVTLDKSVCKCINVNISGL